MSVTATPAGQSGEAAGYATHEVLNQPGSLAGYNAFSGDKALLEAVGVFGADWAGDHLTRAGSMVGSDKVQELARQANIFRNSRPTTVSATTSTLSNFIPLITN